MKKPSHTNRRVSGSAGANPRCPGCEGSILGVVMVVLVVVSFMGVGLLNLSRASGWEAGRSVSGVQAFWAAEGGVEQVKAFGQKRRRPFTSIAYAGSPSGFLWGSNVLSGTTGNGTYAVDVLDDPTWTNAVKALKKYIIRGRATSGSGQKYTVSIKATIQSFASYMHASNWEQSSGGGNIYFASGDIIDGPVYVNDQLNINGSPQFLQSVSSANNSVNYQNGADSSVFQGGLTLNATPLDISGQFTSDHIQDLKTEAESGGLVLNNDQNFWFNSDGTLKYAARSSGATTTTVSLASLNGAIYVNGDVWVDGIVKGKVTVAAQDAIYVSNSVQYASAVSPNPWQTNFNVSAVTDTLGLMASNQVRIVGTNAITLHAALMVTSDGGGFNAQLYNTAFGKPNINLFGSLSQYRRGAVGQVGANGYSKNYKFDTRYNSDAPPNFPYSVYVFSQWSQTAR